MAATLVGADVAVAPGVAVAGAERAGVSVGLTAGGGAAVEPPPQAGSSSAATRQTMAKLKRTTQPRIGFDQAAAGAGVPRFLIEPMGVTWRMPSGLANTVASTP